MDYIKNHHLEAQLTSFRRHLSAKYYGCRFNNVNKLKMREDIIKFCRSIKYPYDVDVTFTFDPQNGKTHILLRALPIGGAKIKLISEV